MESIITTLIDGVLVPTIVAVTGVIPVLLSSGILLLAYALLWIAFAAAVVRDPARVDAAWRRLRSLPLVVQGPLWLLFLPLVAGVWIWRTRWARVARVTLVGGLATWSVLIFLPPAA